MQDVFLASTHPSPTTWAPWVADDLAGSVTEPARTVVDHGFGTMNLEPVGLNGSSGEEATCHPLACRRWFMVRHSSR